MSRTPFLAALLLVTACGSNEPCPANSPTAGSPTALPTDSSEAAKPCNDAGPAAKDVIDSDVMALAAAAKTCPFERGSFDWNCAAYKAFGRENDDLFEGGAANATLLAMLEDEDIRMRSLAADRGFQAGRLFFADKKHAERLLAVVEKERDASLLGRYGRFVAMIDAERTQLGDKIKAYTKHPSLELRQSWANSVLPQHPSAFSLGLVKQLIDDPDNSVRRSAISSLSSGGRTRPSPEICATLGSQLTREDRLAEEALEAGSTSKCDGMDGKVMTEIEKRAKDLKKVTSEEGLDLRSPLSSLCWKWGGRRRSRSERSMSPRRSRRRSTTPGDGAPSSISSAAAT